MKQIITYAIFLLSFADAGSVLAQSYAPAMPGNEYSLAAQGSDIPALYQDGDTTKPKSAYVIEATAPAGVKKSVRRNLDETSFEMGAGFVSFTGGNHAPFGMGLGINIGIINPLHNGKRFAIEYLLDIDYCMAPSKNWYARSIETTPSNIVSMSAGCNLDFGLAFSVILINKHKLAIIAGPELMLQSMFLSSLTLKAGDDGLRDKVLLSAAPGAKVTAYVGDRLIFNLEYSHCLKADVTHDDMTYNSHEVSIPISLKLLRAGVGFRF